MVTNAESKIKKTPNIQSEYQQAIVVVVVGVALIAMP